MEKIKQDIEKLLLVQEQLASENLEKIDFDKLLVQLNKLQTLYENYESLNTEYLVLQKNIITKISIMDKAVLVVSKKRPQLKEHDSKSLELAGSSASELLQSFEKSETKYHAAFPSTFYNVNTFKNRTKDYKSYK